jgi:perosamine synthetase
VLCTKDQELFERALLLGHFNLRAMQDIPKTSKNFELAFTGTGLKYRAHPLALAIALSQIASLDELVQGRNKAADYMLGALRDIPGIEIVGGSDHEIVHAYYALVATIDPDTCGFTREEFAAAVAAENIHYISVPRQMGSMSHYPFFGQLGGATAPTRSADAPLVNSRRITSTAVQFFVPSVAGASDVHDLPLIVEAIQKVGKALPHPR